LTGTTFSSNSAGDECTGTGKVSSFDASGNAVCSGDVDTIGSAGSGLTLTGTTFSANSAGDACTGTSKVSSFDPSGNPLCTVDVDTTYTAGAGLSLTGTLFSANSAGDACTGTSKVSSFDPSGNAVCSGDVDTIGLAGAGLTLVGTTFSANLAGDTCLGTGKVSSFDASGNAVCSLDVDTIGLPGSGLVLSGTTFSADFTTPTGGDNGTATTVARGNHAHDSTYFTKAQLQNTGGTINNTNNPVDWSMLKSVPASIADGDDASSTPRGVLYTVWGLQTCPDGTAPVYSGYASGKKHDDTGSGGNTLCLTSAPTWPASGYSDSNEGGATIYGIDYRMSSYGLKNVTPFNSLDKKNAGCAVCLDASADLELMLPGSQTCPAGWNAKVQGYLMANGDSKETSSFVCVAGTASTLGGGGGGNGARWYPTEAKCGALPCGPYVAHRETTCAICTK
jgi:hypothetical protein